LLTIFVVIVVFSFLILIHEAGHMFAARKIGVRVEIFSMGFGKRLWGFEKGGTEYRLSLIPFGGYVKMSGDEPSEAQGAEDELLSKPPGKRFWVMSSGALINYIFAFVLFSVIFMIGVPTLGNGVGDVLSGFPAEKAGIKQGDRIMSINDKKVEYWDDIVSTIGKEARLGEILDVKIDRDGKIMDMDIKPRISTVTNIFGQTISRPMIGIAPKNEILPVSYDPFRAVYFGGKKLLSLTGMTYKGIWLLITGGMPVKESVSGPIGIAHLMGQAARLGIVPLLVITAHVSMALAIFNLLPFPVLDGGHIIFLAIEKLQGRPLNLKVQEVITSIALVLLIAFALFISWQDVLKFTPLGK